MLGVYEVNGGALKSITLQNGSTLNVVSERINRLVGRTEVFCEVIHTGMSTPSRKDIKQALSKLYGKPEDLIVIKYVKGEFGTHKSRVRANVYDSEDRLKLFEPEYLLKRG